ncbi:uncharacterized protein LOC126906689 isoform X2 [Daktulosphaira vitifoliae]|uniref:uncharacterized protein LOC126906689 isoform X2 n=1 Tax=Daktulosphaira vitifoliae TaxID=58002 RepID=UPI0021AA835E|nr:uncharacterized protein LOC126906689 isoform X2 [Daktulosphaira vitifoliae]
MFSNTKPSPTNKLKKLASSKKPDVLSTGLDLIEDLGPYAPLMFKVGSMFVPGLNNYQIIMMAAKAASLTAKAIKDLKNGDSVSEVGKNVLYDSLKVALSKREFGIESVGNAVKKPYLSVKNWITGSNSGEHKEKSQNDNDGANKNEIAINNKTRLDKMSGEEFLERLTLIQDKLPNPKSVDIENGFEKLVEALDLDPDVSKETKNSLVKALSITTRFFIARAMQPTIISML